MNSCVAVDQDVSRAKETYSTARVRNVQKSWEEFEPSLISMSRGQWMSSPINTVADIEADGSDECDPTLAGTPTGDKAYFQTLNSASLVINASIWDGKAYLWDQSVPHLQT